MTILTPHLKGFTIIPDTIHFGADDKLTVVTAYLQLTDDLISAVKQRRDRSQTGTPLALIVAYDIECAGLYLYCVDDNNTQCLLRLRSNEQTELLCALNATTAEHFGKNPVAKLNEVRSESNLPPL